MLDRRELGDACLDRLYEQWICMRHREGVSVECDEERVHFVADAGECTEEAAEAELACGGGNALDLSPMPSLCAWQCSLAAATGCAVAGCEPACEAHYAGLGGGSAGESSSCAGAALAQWTCLSERYFGDDELPLSGRAPATCDATAIEFDVPAGACEDEADETRSACRGDDRMRIPLPQADAGSHQDGGVATFDAAP